MLSIKIPLDSELVMFMSIVVVPAICYMALVAYVYLTQRRFQYRPTHGDVQGVGRAPFVPWRDMQSGNFIAYIRPARRPRRVVIVFHGNGGEALDWAWFKDIVPRDQLLILAEYPGYGARSGHPTEASLFQAAADLLGQVKKRWQLPITLVGESLGTGVASYVASCHTIDRLALVSPFSSLLDVAIHHCPLLPVRYLLKDRFLSEGYLSTLEIPLHIIHGSSDHVVPISLGQRLLASHLGASKWMTQLPGYDHTTIKQALVSSKLAEPFRHFLTAERLEGVSQSTIL